MRKSKRGIFRTFIIFSCLLLSLSAVSSCFFFTPPAQSNPPGNPPKAPEISGETPTNNATPTWTWTVPEGTTGISYRLDSTTGQWMDGPATQTSFTPSEPLTDGTHILYVRFKNDAGEWSAIGSHHIVIDTTSPPVPLVIVEVPAGYQRPLWSWSMPSGTDPLPVKFRFQLDGEDETAWSEVGAAVTSFQPVSDLSEDAHILSVQAADASDNWSASGSAVADAAWRCETVDSRSASVGHSITMDCDPAGNPVICYIDAVSASVFCAAWNGMGWEFETIEDTNVGSMAAMVLDPAGNRDIIFMDQSDKVLRVSYYDIFLESHQEWEIEGKSNPNWPTVASFRIAVDNESRIYMVRNRNTLGLRYYWLEGKQLPPPIPMWPSTPFPSSDTMWSPSLVTLSSNSVKVAYMKTSGVFIATWKNPILEDNGMAVADPGLDAACDTRIVHDADDRLGIAYSTPAGGIYYAAENGSSFDTVVAHEASGSVLGSFTLAFDFANSRPVLLYVEGDDLWCAVPAAASWLRELVDTGVAEQVAVGVDVDGRISAAYYDAENGHLKFAKRGLPAP